MKLKDLRLVEELDLTDQQRLGFVIYRNPTREELARWVDKPIEIRGWLHDGDSWFWPAELSVHVEVMKLHPEFAQGGISFFLYPEQQGWECDVTSSIVYTTWRETAQTGDMSPIYARVQQFPWSALGIDVVRLTTSFKQFTPEQWKMIKANNPLPSDPQPEPIPPARRGLWDRIRGKK